MNTVTLSIVLILLTAVCVGLCLYILARLKHVVYLLEQPVVKKLSPELKLKTVKVDEGENHGRHGQRPQHQGQGRPQPSPRPENQGNRDRNGRHEGQPHRSEGAPNRGDRPERTGNDNRGHDRDRNRDRGGRNERNDRNDRGDRGDRPERHRPRLEVFSSEAPATPSTETAPRHSEAHAAAPAAVQHERPALAPRRPLPASVERDESATPAFPAPEAGSDPVFAGEDGDMQHGRRTQLKKKPRFEVNEEELKSEETKV